MKVFVGGTREQRAAAVRASLAAPPRSGPAREVHAAAHWPFLRHVMPPIRPPVFGGGSTLWLRDLHLAFPAARAPGVRLVLTQSTYQLQRVLDALDTNPAYVLVADADDRIRPEMSGRRGPWARIEVVDLGPGPRAAAAEGPPYEAAEAFADIPACAAALLLHRATSELETQRPEAAGPLVEEALRLDPSWEATHFEMGKLQLRREDTERAAVSFAEAGRLMPSFAAAFGNLGAALGEMDRADAALRALQQALRHDPYGFPILNNIGAVHREAGRLDDAEAAFRQVITLAPGFVFGHYNLGHALFLQGRFDDARAAYEEGQRRDPQKNARQACRLAMARAAAGDTAGAIDELEAVSGSVGGEMMRALAAEAEQTLLALLTVAPARAPELNRVLGVIRGLGQAG
jgi:tetratricopeptide (TPR) repeat protein